MKGVLLAGGKATRFYPVTLSTSKHLIPIYDKPMIYYPISVFMLAGIRDILIITNPYYTSLYKKLLGNGEDFGLNFIYKEQSVPRGLADAFLIGEDFIGNEDVCLILGDNFIYGKNLQDILKNAILHINKKKGNLIFSYPVEKPSEYGIIEIDKNNNIISIEEKPKIPKSNLALIGIYFYDNSVVNMAKNIRPSSRGEIEISCINNEYLKLKKTKVINLSCNDFLWFDTGTCDDLCEASNFVKNIITKTNSQIACLEEIAFLNKWIDKKKLEKLIEKLKNTKYGEYLKRYII